MPNEPIMPAASACIIDLDLTQVALCNIGANSRANILLTKRKENNQMPTSMTFDEVAKSLEAPALEAINKHFEEQLAAKDAKIEELSKAVEDMKKSLPAAEPKPTTAEELLKSASPELAAFVKKQQEVLDALVAKDQQAVAAQRYEAVKSIPCDENKLKEVLKSISPAGFEILTAAAQAIEKNVTKEPQGSDADGQLKKSTSGETAYAILEKSAKEIQAANAGCTFEKAFTMACEQNASVYADYVKGE